MAKKNKKKNSLRMLVPFEDIVPLAVEMNGCKCMLYIKDTKGRKQKIALKNVEKLSVSPVAKKSK